MPSPAAPDPSHHARRLGKQIDELIAHLRRDIDAVGEPQFRAVCETAAEVLTGLKTALTHYQQGDEAAWSRGPGAPDQGVVKDLRGQEQPRDPAAARLP